jgi:aspartate/methionine/tyrosine aminotransferase
MEALHQLPSSCTIAPGEGAFYFVLKVNTSLNAFELVKKLIEEHKIAVLPGTTFGIHQGCCLRVAYGVLKPETAAPAIERLVTGLQVILG